jgi:glycosyltransferase involved in cell wall biosynthesis
MDANRRPLRILVFCTGRIDRPRSGGDLRVHWLFRELAALGHHVDLHSLVVRNHPAGRFEPVGGFNVRLHHSVCLDLAALADRMRLVPKTELPTWLAPLRGWAGRLGRRARYDIVHFELPWFAGLARAAAGTGRVVYGAQNVEWIWWRGALLRWPLGRRWRARLRDHERAALAVADGAIACTANDARWLARQGRGLRAGVAELPNGYDARRVRPPSDDERATMRARFGFGPDQKVAIFVASNTAPNAQAARMLADQSRALPESLRYVIAGRVCEGLQMASSPAFQVLGPRDDVLPLLWAADVGLNPVLTGSGSNLKLVEYCAAGLPVITTRFGLRGFQPLEPWVAIADADAFPRTAAAQARPGPIPEEILKPYSWEALAAKLARFYDAVARS